MIIILVKQILQMFLLAGIGFLLFKGGKITLEGSKTLGNILIFGSLPAVIINGFRIERTAEHVSGLLWSALAALIVVMLSILMSVDLLVSAGALVRWRDRQYDLPAITPIGEQLDEHFDDERMEEIYNNMVFVEKKGI